MTTSMLRRQLKNLVQNYSEAEVKVREATSNDPWGPSSSQMADISDLTYNAVACNEIMTMLWKRLKDDRNWRHIHKSLTLLEYILKTGDDRVLLKLKDNIYIVKALTEYRFVEKDGKDQGGNVREKAKVVLILMEDDEKLKAEREFAVKTREKTSKGSAASSADDIKDPNYRPCYVPGGSGLPSLSNIPSVADLTASFEARKEERVRQEAEKKETERRAKMSEDELQWEDAGKDTGKKVNAWGGEKEEKEKEEEEKSDAWGALKEPSSDAWGAQAKTEDAFATAKADEDPFAAPENGEDPFAAPKNGEDPFAAPKNGEDPFAPAKTDEDPFAAPKNGKDPFAAPKDKPDPFSSSNNDPFNAPKDDPFNAPKDDPFNAPKDDPFNALKDDPFNAPKDDPFNAPKDDPFNAPKDDPFSAPTEDPFNAPKGDPFNAPKDDPFNAPKDDPFNAPTDDSFNAAKDDPFNGPTDDPFNTPTDDSFNAAKDDPFNAPQNDAFTASSEDPFNTPKDDPFTAPTSAAPKQEPTLSKDDPFTSPTTPPKDLVSTPTKPVLDYPFAAPTTPPKEDLLSTSSKPMTDDPFSAPAPPQVDPFSAMSKLTKDDPFGTPSTPPKEDPFAVPASPPKDDTSDPFNDPPEAMPQDSADAWGAPFAPKETKSGDPWGNGASASSPVHNSDPFGDSSKPDEDLWGAPAPVSADDAWGAPAPPSDSSPSGDPFGDGASKSNDPWGAPSNTSGSGAGKQTVQEEKIYRKAASFLGSAGASLVDLDDLFSSNPKPGQRPLIHPLSAQTQAIGNFRAKDIAAAPMARSGAFASTSAYYPNHFGSSLAPPGAAVSPAFGAASPTGDAPLIQQPSYALGAFRSAASMLQAAPEIRMVQPVSARGNPQVGLGMVRSGYPGSNPLGAGDARSSFLGESNPTGAGIFRSSTPQTTGGSLFSSGLDETINKNNNPFLF